MKRGHAAWACLVAFCVVLVGPSAFAHGLHPGVLSLVERAPNTFAVAWTQPVDTQGTAADVTVAFPDPCREVGSQLQCGAAGLKGSVRVIGLDAVSAPVSVQVRWLDGRAVEGLVTADQPHLDLRTASARASGAWLVLGIEHVLGGLDHLAFVLGLLLVLGARDGRRLVGTLTAFTLAHSLTLGLSAVGVLSLSPAPVEAMIAASVMLVAREAGHQQATLTRRAPWVVALLFGLIHGLGFATGLGELGLPRDGALHSVLWFNLGVEVGQVAAVAVFIAVGALAKRALGRRVAAAHAVLTTALGGVGAWWLIDRVAHMV
ncbi:MAG: HupE/UreJ family protein [Myxococcota bacterium]